MYISGLAFDRKKISASKKITPPPKIEQQRPHSSQLPQINQIRSHTSNNKIMNLGLKKQKTRNSSYNKILLTNKMNSKKVSQSQNKEYVTENTQPQKKHELSITKKKKLELVSKQDQGSFAISNQFKILSYFRYYPIIIIQSCGMKDQFMKTLTEKGDFVAYNPRGKKLAKKSIGQFWSKLTKLAQLKGKYKYRQKFNYNYSAQLKALNYKKKQAKKKKESQSSSSDDDNDKKQKCRDMDTWKKAMGVEGSKVFIVKGKYKDLRNALIERGWVENQDKHSLFYDLKWTTKVNDVNFETLRPNQLVNHFNNNACLTSKYGLCKSLRSIMYSQSIDVDKFFPKAFDLSDLSDFQNFLEIYKWIFCQSLLKKFVSKVEQTNKDMLALVKIALIVTQRRFLKAQKLLSNIVNGKYNLCSINEWNFLLGQKEVNFQELSDQICHWQLQGLPQESLKRKCEECLQKVIQNEPQYNLNGAQNIWIVKPAFLSRGRGIKCLSDFTDILDYSIGKETQYVVQKYIENPLIINRRKFDIRQWVIVQDYNPPKIWFYGEFYVRFCLQDYNPSKLNNKFAHLTNNSIQKHNSKINVEQLLKESMWTMEQLNKFVDQMSGEGSFKNIVAKMKQIVVATIISTADQVYGRKNSFQLIGYDFMIDESLDPWLIEINSSPSMDYSTPVTRRLVKMVLEDTVKVVIDLKKKKSKKKNAGLFKCIYNGESPYQFKYYQLNSKDQ